MGDFYGTGIEIWAGFGPVRQLLRRFFSCFHGQKKIFKNIADGENIFGIRWLHRLKDFEAMKAEKLAIWPKYSPNFNSCSIKISHCGTSI